ncbi:transporter suffix domain-containing protein [Thiomicrorhabdus lithotrophica]|uniref:Transporter suffix domain-containing protein n=1 Tax=Thiomicrorhabdus lithotrophica TaxID=2949997 RepID=A0ABY8CFS1_9GAMM|nr:transporter suffix domain-containing protein [Thiomicrorhabdus lithotrophica]WEJ63540.1 transporter suffix domain-containing protein [Thiomicrorhabdus lithotrophica]
MTLKERFAPFIKPLAYTLMAVSTIAWTMVFVIPFLDFSVAEIAGIITLLIIIGEIAFYIAILLLGKPLWEKIKHYWLHKISNQPKD